MVISRKVAIIVITVLIFVAVVIALVLVFTNKDDGDDDKQGADFKASVYSKYAVAADREDCSKIGSDVLKKGGTAVDAAVSVVFCVGLLNMHSCGVGGGGFMNVYLRQQKKSIIYDFRETAPAKATEKMYLAESASSTVGGLASAIPGTVKGLRHVWRKHGKLPWKELIDPTIKIAREGFIVSKAVGDKIVENKDKISKNEGFRRFLKKADGTWYKTGDMLKNPQLADTLETISNNPNDFYNGTIAQQIVDDIQDAGGIITLDDLKGYRVAERESLNTKINNNEFYFMPPPGGGAVVGMAMNILKGYNFTMKDFSDANLISTTHKIIEALKFSFARRPLLGDPSFEKNVSKVTDEMFDQDFAEQLRQKIKEKPFLNETYYGGFYEPTTDQGTTHVSILGENGDAVAVTDTINYGFGGGVRSTRNGIIYNNEMDDFSTPGLANLWGYLPAKANYIKPGKRPLSSMSPTIVTNDNGDVIMVVGASGGSRIITAVLQTMVRKLYFGMDLDDSVSKPRVHTHLLPYKVYLNNQFKVTDELKQGLKDLEHDIEMSNYWSAVQAIYRDGAGSKIYAVSDPRKGGLPAGE